MLARASNNVSKWQVQWRQCQTASLANACKFQQAATASKQYAGKESRENFELDHWADNGSQQTAKYEWLVLY